MFPEYIKDDWNLVKLTARQHYIAHHMLARAFGRKMWFAFHMICYAKTGRHQKNNKITNRIYEEIKRNKTHSEETKKEMSKSRKGRKLSEEHKRNISKGQIGKTLTKEQREKISIARKGTKLSKKHRRKISEGLKRSGRTISTKQKEQMRNGKIKKLKSMTNEELEIRRLKRSGENNSMYGTKHTDETKKKMAKARMEYESSLTDKQKTERKQKIMKRNVDKMLLKYKKHMTDEELARFFVLILEEQHKILKRISRREKSKRHRLKLKTEN